MNPPVWDSCSFIATPKPKGYWRSSGASSIPKQEAWNNSPMLSRLVTTWKYKIWWLTPTTNGSIRPPWPTTWTLALLKSKTTPSELSTSCIDFTAPQRSLRAAEYSATQHCGQGTGPGRGFENLVPRLEQYVEDAACREATHQEETSRCTSKLADAHSKLEALIKELNDFSQTNQSELNRLKDLAHAAKAKIVKLKDNFVKYDDHLQMALEEKLDTFHKETEEALLLAIQTPAAQGVTTVVPEMDEIQRQIDSLTISNNGAFLEIKKVNERHKQQQADL
ncbi:hypothetical protein DSO57_1024220 [Entomophthora muscae]|uniref:Uncharacterized protein n=1 Tax=Entomophthora muscae TaxID=34485 RepID=A0ACC2SRW5_9FUNG|nr:hypothetical protein DSO57_1024220 [Entomophthora muscae]